MTSGTNAFSVAGTGDFLMNFRVDLKLLDPEAVWLTSVRVHQYEASQSGPLNMKEAQ